MVNSERHPCLIRELPSLPRKTLFGFLWLSFLQLGPSCSLSHLKNEHILWHSGATNKGVLSNPRKHLPPQQGSVCPGVMKTKKRRSLCAPLRFSFSSGQRQWLGVGRFRWSLFSGCTVNQSCHGVKRKASGWQLFSPCSCLPWTQGKWSGFLRT